MYYVVQDNVFRETNYNNLIYALERLELPHEIVAVIPFEDSFRFETKRIDVFPFGSVKMARVSKELGWNPGSQMNDNHDYLVYKDYYKDNLLNYDSKIIKFGDTDFFSKERFFARPTKDTKVFTGQEFDFGEWEEFRERALTNGHSTLLDSETEIQIASIKKIYKEIRFWVVKGEIVTASQYRLGNRLVLSDDVDKEAYTYCNKMIKLFELNDGFVMDLALTDDGYKIIECGCINCAGFYEADMQKLLMTLEEKF